MPICGLPLCAEGPAEARSMIRRGMSPVTYPQSWTCPTPHVLPASSALCRLEFSVAMPVSCTPSPAALGPRALTAPVKTCLAVDRLSLPIWARASFHLEQDC